MDPPCGPWTLCCKDGKRTLITKQETVQNRQIRAVAVCSGNPLLFGNFYIHLRRPSLLYRFFHVQYFVEFTYRAIPYWKAYSEIMPLAHLHGPAQAPQNASQKASSHFTGALSVCPHFRHPIRSTGRKKIRRETSGKAYCMTHVAYMHIVGNFLKFQSVGQFSPAGLSHMQDVIPFSIAEPTPLTAGIGHQSFNRNADNWLISAAKSYSSWNDFLKWGKLEMNRAVED